jgi:hypothetical protein
VRWRAEPLTVIVPDTQTLEVEAMVLNCDIGGASEGHAATVKWMRFRSCAMAASSETC